MCGVVGYVGREDALPILLEGLRRLEYRGYDSAGAAVLGAGGIRVCKLPGRVDDLARASAGADLSGTLGIAHTRWATHGAVTQANAHPHLDCEGKLAIVHNGIIERAAAHRSRLALAGHRFVSETDSEVIAHEIEDALEGRDPRSDLAGAVASALSKFPHDAWAVAAIHANVPDTIVVARNRSPLVAGAGADGSIWIASDPLALAARIPWVLALKDGDVVKLQRGSSSAWVMNLLRTRKDGEDDWKMVPLILHEAQFGNPLPTEEQVEKGDFPKSQKKLIQEMRSAFKSLNPPAFVRVPSTHSVADKGEWPHFMLKEIHEQPTALRNCLRAADGLLEGGGIPRKFFEGIERVQLLGCGTAFHACLVGKMAIEEFAGIPANSTLGSEFRYGFDPVGKGTLCIAVSQSGETADTLASAEEARRKGARLLAIVNVEHSTLARISDAVLPTKAGPEIGVASTKAYTTQIASLLRFAIRLDGSMDWVQ